MTVRDTVHFNITFVRLSFVKVKPHVAECQRRLKRSARIRCNR